MNVLMGVAVTLTCALVLFLIVYILYKGLPNITWELLSTSPSYLSGTIGILPDILNTVYLVLATLVFVLPLGVGAAIYLTEYAKNKRIVAIIEYAAETLSGKMCIRDRYNFRCLVRNSRHSVCIIADKIQCNFRWHGCFSVMPYGLLNVRINTDQFTNSYLYAAFFVNLSL